MRCPGHPHERGLVSYFSFTSINNRNISVSIIREPIECSDHNNHQSTEHPESEELYLNLQNHGMSPDNGTLHFNSEYNLLETYKFQIQILSPVHQPESQYKFQAQNSVNRDESILPWKNSNKRKTIGLNPSSINYITSSKKPTFDDSTHGKFL